ncbi:MAG TPA: glycosyltransferase family 4 protein [Candidatus Nanoarchaeia archaeon]|nr:glycosyltransferase family 4 protein [Candidatus Nanoarchaeia archaeon]
MKILVIMKRFGANKDMVMQNFGRQVRMFENLAKKHQIDFLCPDYTRKESKIVEKNGLRFFVVPVSFFSIFSFLHGTKKLIKKENYDVIVATSDPLIGALGNHLSKKFSIPLIYDLQDNFETYDTYKFHFVANLHKKVVEEADIVLTVSEALKEHISKTRKRPTYVIQNGIELNLFKPIDREKARKKLKLPLKSKIITYIGHLEKLKGANILLEAFEKVRQDFPDTFLLLSGEVEKGIDIKQKNILFRAFPKREDVVLGINSSDVAVVPNTVNEFTKYCFPYKLAEYMACNVHIVATDIGDVSLMLKKYNGSLAAPDNAEELSEKIMLKLENNSRPDYSEDTKNFDWRILSEKLNEILKNLK